MVINVFSNDVAITVGQGFLLILEPRAAWVPIEMLICKVNTEEVVGGPVVVSWLVHGKGRGHTLEIQGKAEVIVLILGVPDHNSMCLRGGVMGQKFRAVVDNNTMYSTLQER